MPQAVPPQAPDTPVAQQEQGTVDLVAVVLPLFERWRLLVALPLLAGTLAVGSTYLMDPTYTARTTFMPPQQQQSTAAAALASIGALANLSGGAGALRSPAEQYVALMQSVTVQDRLIDRFKLLTLYNTEYRFQARKKLAQKVRITVGKRDGLITVEADDSTAERAAELANAHVEELRRLTATLAVTEAQQRRMFFEQQLQQSKARLTAAQEVLQASGFSLGALNTEPKATAERYARLKAEVTSAEVKLQSMGNSFNNAAHEVTQQRALLDALRGQLARTEAPSDSGQGVGYVSKYRDFKYEESLFELFARQYELAKADEARDGVLIQVVDAATPPERRSKPSRAMTGVLVTAGAAVLLAVGLMLAPAMSGFRARLKSLQRAATPAGSAPLG
jgi:uncharacterized protein involved in exopolysaccharide biosynthesis